MESRPSRKRAGSPARERPVDQSMSTSAAAEPKLAARGLSIRQRLSLIVLVVAIPMLLLSAGDRLATGRTRTRHQPPGDHVFVALDPARGRRRARQVHRGRAGARRLAVAATGRSPRLSQGSRTGIGRGFRRGDRARRPAWSADRQHLCPGRRSPSAPAAGGDGRASPRVRDQAAADRGRDHRAGHQDPGHRGGGAGFPRRCAGLLRPDRHRRHRVPRSSQQPAHA